MQEPDTSSKPLTVLVIGAGIGGLALAHGLRRHGITVRLYDRDGRLEDTGGYRLHLDGTATAALATHLPPTLFQAILASSTGAGQFTEFTMLDHRLRPLLHRPTERGTEQVLIGRIPLRRLLAHGLSAELHLRREFTGHTREADGTVTAHFADGHTDNGDLLVGADGARSRVVAALAGRPASRELRAGGLAGFTPLTGATRHLLPEAVRGGPAFVFGPGGMAMFLTAHYPDTATVAAVDCRDVSPIREEPYALWGLTVPGGTGHMTADPRRHAAELTAGWATPLRELVAAATPASVGAFPYLAADPDAPLLPWPAGVVTALGDAVHAMPPTGGRGAATAIRDADALTRQLVRVAAGETTVPLAVREYQRQVPEYAAEAIRISLQPLELQRKLGGRLGYAAFRHALPVADAARRLIRR